MVVKGPACKKPGAGEEQHPQAMYKYLTAAVNRDLC